MMSFDRLGLCSDPTKSGRHIVLAEAARVKPVFQRSYRTVMLEWPSIPEAFQGWHLVITGSTPRLQCQIWICAYDGGKNVISLEMVIGDLKPLRWNQPVIGIKRGRMAASTSLLLEDPLAASSDIINLVWIGRRPQGVEIKRQCIELFVAIASPGGRIRQSSKVSRSRDKAAIACKVVGSLV